MFRKLLEVVGLGGVFGETVQQPEEPATSEFHYGELTAMSLPELAEHNAPLLHVMTSKSAGISRIVGQTDEIVIQSEDTEEDIIIPADEGNIDFPVNEMTRVFEIGEYETFDELKKDIQTWQADESVTRIGQQAIDENSTHIITIVPSEYSAETRFERIKLDQTTGDAGWTYLEQKFNEHKGQEPGPAFES